ncbi:MAG: biotin/lipoyl-binding protein [Acidimicrobiia bacterium]|nr:biotin/lipoyl-binding protein [Acidimicrobiia bacterium]
MAELTVTPLGGGRYRVSDRASHVVAYAVQSGRERWVFIEGMVYVVAGTDSRGGIVHATDDDVALSAPMPATVAAINVTPGQEVETGDLLIMLEAMKMELPIRAPRAGRVTAIGCAKGELVQPGVTLLELE